MSGSTKIGPMPDYSTLLTNNLAAVRDRIATAAEQSHRKPEDICLVGVTKYVDAEVTRQFVQAGCMDLGESRPQALWPKAESLSDLEVRWHQIGHLQRNKLRKTQPLISLIHSVDSIRLLHSINELQEEISPEQPQDILLEINTSGDSAKHGFSPDAIREAIDAVSERSNVVLRGLMCMAGLGTSVAEARQDFARLRTLRDSLADEYSQLDFSELSMGMSSDFEAAIAEGATLVRVGSVLFEGIR